MRYSPEERFLHRRCTGCGACAAVCPSGAVSMRGGRPAFHAGLCIRCGHCGVFCPVNAFDLDPVACREAKALPGGFRDLVSKRWSVRFYKDIVPSDEQIDELLSILDRCPTGRNAQGITVRVIRGADAASGLFSPVRRIIGILSIAGIPQLIGKLTGTGEHLRRIRDGDDLVFRGAPVIMFFFAPGGSITGRTDGVIAAAAVMYHAVSMGMGTLWNGVAEKLYPFIRSWHSPSTRGMRLAAVLCAGLPAMKPHQEAPGRDFTVILEDVKSP